MVDHRFSSRFRVRKQAEFDRVFQSNVYAADDVLVVAACRNDLPHSRLGLAVSRKVGNAVLRNRWKRVLREVFRRHREALPTGIDFVLRPKRGANCDYHAVEKSLPRLAERVARRLARGTS